MHPRHRRFVLEYIIESARHEPLIVPAHRYVGFDHPLKARLVFVGPSEVSQAAPNIRLVPVCSTQVKRLSNAVAVVGDIAVVEVY